MSAPHDPARPDTPAAFGASDRRQAIAIGPRGTRFADHVSVHCYILT